MPRGNATLVNFASGELSPFMHGRVDLPIYQHGLARCQNFISLPQGGARYRNGFRFVHNTRNHQVARLIPFHFSTTDTYVIELTNQKMRFYRNGGAILETSKNISGLTQANPAVVTATSHGFSNGDEVFITGVKGMVEVNGQFFKVAGATANTFTLQDTFGANINSTNFSAYASGGTVARVFELASPYLETHQADVHFTQSADTVYLTHSKYGPYKLTRTGHTSWTLSLFDRTADPFKQKVISSVTRANPGVFTTSTNHELAVNDEVYIGNAQGMTEINFNRYLVNTVPSATTFTLKDSNGTPLDTTNFGAYTADTGRVIPTKLCPYSVAFMSETRLAYGGGDANPDRIVMSRAPDPTTGATRFDDFTTGANAADSIVIFLAAVTQTQEAIRWLAPLSDTTVVGTYGSIRRLQGDGGSPITPSTIRAPLVNNIGASLAQPVANGNSLFYIENTKKAVRSFTFDFQTNSFVTIDQNLASDILVAEGIVQLVEQRGRPDILWVLRADGILTGMTHKESENIFGWHRHLIGGSSKDNNSVNNFAKVLSIATELRAALNPRLWAVVERTLGTKTMRSVEYLEDAVTYPVEQDFYTGAANRIQDITNAKNNIYERVKGDVYLDSALTYDGSKVASGITMTPSATTGQITITASAPFFESSMVGREIWKGYLKDGSGGGRAEITGVSSTTVALATVLVAFDNASAIPSGQWFLTHNKIYGLLHLQGQTVSVQLDGAPGTDATVDSSGAITLSSQSSMVHVGFKYLGVLQTMNIDVAGLRGSAQAKIRRMFDAAVRFAFTIGAKVGTSLYNLQPIVFKTLDDLTDRPTHLFTGIQRAVLDDSHTRQNRTICVVQDVPSPMTVISIDTMVETSDD